MVLKNAAAVLTLLMVAGCAQTYHWQSESVAKENWPGDRAACRRNADQEVERELAGDDLAAAGGGYGSNAPSAFGAQMALFDARKRQRIFFTQCMQARGYEKVRSP